MTTDPHTAPMRWGATVFGYGNAEPHDEPKRAYTEADFAEFNAANDRAKSAYYGDPETEQVAAARAKAVRKAEAQKRYRDKLKETS